MLNRAMSTPSVSAPSVSAPNVSAPGRWTAWQRGLSTKQAAILLRYVLVVAVLSAVGCLYLWQINTIATISAETLELEKKAVEIEAANTVLMQQLARWESPPYIDQRTRALGMAPAGPPVVVQVPEAAMPRTVGVSETGLSRLIEAFAAGASGRDAHR